MQKKIDDIKEFFTISELSSYVSVKEKTLYSMVAARIIPHYKIGRLVRFSKPDIDAWMASLKVAPVDTPVQAGKITRSAKSGGNDVDRIVRRAIDEVRNSAYNTKHGKPGKRIKGQRKEAK